MVAALNIPFELALTMVGYLVTGLATYFKAMSDIQSEFAAMRLEREQGFVKKDDMKEVSAKLQEIAEAVATIKGYIQKEP